MSVPEITDLLQCLSCWQSVNVQEGSSQLTRWKTVYGGCRHLCTSYLHVYGGAPGQFPCHPGDEEKKIRFSSVLASMVKNKSSSANMIGNE